MSSTVPPTGVSVTATTADLYLDLLKKCLTRLLFPDFESPEQLAIRKDGRDWPALAETMVDLGADAGMTMVALITDMSTPLGLTAGNAIEVQESLDVLAGGGPADVVALTLARCALDKFGGDSMKETKRNFAGYLEQLKNY